MSPELTEFREWVRQLMKDCSIYMERNTVGVESTLEEEEKMRKLYKIYQLYCPECKQEAPPTYAEKYG